MVGSWLFIIYECEGDLGPKLFLDEIFDPYVHRKILYRKSYPTIQLYPRYFF
jgi:hypothetical protein